MEHIDRYSLHFIDKAKKFFGFFAELGFSEILSPPSLIKYIKDDIEIDIYHGRASYEIGMKISKAGKIYTISEIIRHKNPDVAKNFRYKVAKTETVVTAALEELVHLIQRYGNLAIHGDPKFYLDLNCERDLYLEKYALDTLASQLRPQADKAFREKNYVKATELYSRIEKNLSQTELKKLKFAKKNYGTKLAI